MLGSLNFWCLSPMISSYYGEQMVYISKVSISIRYKYGTCDGLIVQVIFCIQIFISSTLKILQVILEFAFLCLYQSCEENLCLAEYFLYSSVLGQSLFFPWAILVAPLVFSAPGIVFLSGQKTLDIQKQLHIWQEAGPQYQ